MAFKQNLWKIRESRHVLMAKNIPSSSKCHGQGFTEQQCPVWLEQSRCREQGKVKEV